MLHLLTQVILLSAYFCVKAHCLPDNLIISLPDGKIKGTTYPTSNGKTYYGFQGIPFATPPVGELRLEPPQPAKPWDGILDTTQDVKSCITAEYLLNPEAESEDCLYLNVYIPNVKEGLILFRCRHLHDHCHSHYVLKMEAELYDYHQNFWKHVSSLRQTSDLPEIMHLNDKVDSNGQDTSPEELPVMVWVFGGAFHSGNNQKKYYGPDFLMEQDVILVTLNYRLHVFGFLSTEDSNLPGNMGLKDQNLALKWVQKNIEYFGGDANKVTLFGQSAGGTSVGLHLVSKKSKGLFRAAIVESGSALVFWSLNRAAKQQAFQIADSIPGANFGTDSKVLKEFLKNSTVEEIMFAYIAVTAGKDLMVPTIEPDNEDAFISQPYYDLIAKGDFNQVPILTGVCAEESLMTLTSIDIAQQVGQRLDKNPETIVPVSLRPNVSDILTVAQKIKNIYIKEDEKFAENLVSLAEYETDQIFRRGVIKQAELSSKYVPVYLYEFSYYGRPLYKPSRPGAEKAGHGAEVRFLFNMTGFFTDNDPDILTQNRVVTLWANFAKYLNPTPKQSELFQNLTWPTITPDNLQYLSINSTMEVRPYIKKESYQTWNDIYETYGAKPFITF